jgi:uncharacterized membrane protein YozB (DUF420 family)
MRKTPVVLGVLSMVFGGIQALMSLFGLVTQPFAKQMMGGFGKAFSGLPKQEGQPDMGEMFDRLAKVMDQVKVYNYLINFAMLVFAVALIIVGWMLYKRRVQSRKLSVIWAAAALAYLPLHLYVQVAIIQPRTNEATAEMMKIPGASASAMQSMASLQGVVLIVFHLLFYTPFPIILLLLMGRQSAKNDLVGPTPAAI